ncbi:MAG: ATP-binding protein [Eubacteriales bacterium]|nr:ATP-binding protein [Eubacteriales bacterium]
MIGNELRIEDILHEYEKTRLENKRRLQERTEEVYEKIPEIESLDRENKLAYLQAAKLRIAKDDASIAEANQLQEACRIRSKRKKSLLVSTGYAADYLDTIYQCKVCKDTGFIDGSRCRCFLTRIIDSLYLQSNLKNVLAQENFNTFSFEYYSKEIPSGMSYSPYDNMMQIVKRSGEFINCFKKEDCFAGNILIYGETGLGKTFLTNCIAKELLDDGHSVFYLSANDLFESILAEYLLNRKTDLEDLYKYIYNTELLIIDDLGTELTNNFVASQLFEIVNKRNLTKRSTLISTNLSMKQLRDRYSERIMSRIIDNYIVFNIYGDNIRYQKRKKAIHAIT